MTAGRRRGSLTAMLVASGLLCGACTAADGMAAFEPPEPLPEPSPTESQLSLGNRLLAAREPALAMKAYSASLGTEGFTAEALTGAGIAARQQGMLGAARRYFEYARDLAPDSAIAHNNLGVVLLALKEYDAAHAAFRAAMSLSGGENERIRRNLERAETMLAGRDGGPSDAAPAPQVVRLGTDAFRLTGQPGTEQELPAEYAADQEADAVEADEQQAD